MTLVIATGTFAVIADELDWLLHSEMRSSSGNEMVSWGTMEDAVRAYAPYDTFLNLSAGEDDYFNYRALMINSAQKTYYLFVDQFTGEITGTTSSLTVQRFLRDLHRYLFMPSIIGLPLVTSMAVILLISLYTGLKTTRNWRTIATRIRLNKGTRVAVGDFHKAIGLWGSWFLVLIVITSFWYFAELSFAVNRISFEPSRPGISADRAAEYGPAVRLANADELVRSAQTAMPGFIPTQIQFSTRGTLAATVLGRMKDPVVRQRANRVFIDPFDASVIWAQRSNEIGWVAYINELADPLHFGSFGKLTTKIIWFLFGLGLLAMSLSGVYLTWQRVKTKTPTYPQYANIPILVLAIIFGVPYVSSYLVSNSPDYEVTSGPQKLEHMDVELKLVVDESDTPLGKFTLIATARDKNLRLNLTEAVISIVDVDKPDTTIRARTLGSRVIFSGDLNETGFAIDNQIRIFLHTYSGDHFDYTFNSKNAMHAITTI
ncbi:MAG: putative iron-regulated membrane protein [Candidatus Azotimanducaceae bacterium]|jgi:uncharacterized iron-regulated membrane protein